LTSPVVWEPSVELTVTVRPKRSLACSEFIVPSIACEAESELNCASCATKSVPDCGFNGSCEVICVTSSLRKSAWPSVCCGMTGWSAAVLLVLEPIELTDDINLGPGFPAAGIRATQ